MVKFTKNKAEPGSGPSSAIGIMRFFDADSKSPQLNPYFVAGATVVFVVVILIIKMTVFKTVV